MARKTGQSFHLVTERGKGSHVTVYLGNRLTVVQDRKKELYPPIFAEMCKQLGIDPGDL